MLTKARVLLLSSILLFSTCASAEFYIWYEGNVKHVSTHPPECITSDKNGKKSFSYKCSPATSIGGRHIETSATLTQEDAPTHQQELLSLQRDLDEAQEEQDRLQVRLDSMREQANINPRDLAPKQTIPILSAQLREKRIEVAGIKRQIRILESQAAMQ